MSGASSEPQKSSLFLLFLSPFVVFLYYAVFIAAFRMSIDFSVNNVTRGTGAVSSGEWGTHWIYRIVAEWVSLSGGTLVASGMARGRERVAGIIAGSVIGFFHFTALSVFLYVSTTSSSDVFEYPWYQYVISGTLIIASPIIGINMGKFSDVINKEFNGFWGINRGHFLWLWIVMYFYLLGLISPVITGFVIQFYDWGIFGNLLMLFKFVILSLIPSIFFIAPLYLGLNLLSGSSGQNLGVIARNLSGFFVLVLGILFGAGLQYGWHSILRWVSG